MEKAISEGKGRIDQDAAGACFAGVDGFTESRCVGPDPAIDFTALLEACNSVWVGLVADGQACATDLECASGTCNDGAASCGGTCAPTAPPDPPTVGENETCDFQAGPRCDDELVCSEGKCVRLPAENQDCLGAACASGLFCAEGKCVKERAAGESCTNSGFFGAGFASDCRGAQVCKGVGIAIFGAPDPATGTCSTPVGVGGSCAAGTGVVSGCFSDLPCDPADQKCKVPPPAGQPCLTGRCDADAWCDNGTCAAEKANGTACEDDDECVSDSCVEGSCAADSATEACL